jgi:3-hydroxyisobutyrate dehydrogenase
MIDRDHEAWFMAEHAAKDSGLAKDLADNAGLNLPLNDATKAQYDKLTETGKGQLDKSAISELTFLSRQ